MSGVILYCRQNSDQLHAVLDLGIDDALTGLLCSDFAVAHSGNVLVAAGIGYPRKF